MNNNWQNVSRLWANKHATKKPTPTKTILKITVPLIKKGAQHEYGISAQ
jgi:hypothetical protein